MTTNKELIQNLVASSADQALRDITDRVIQLSERYGWTQEVAQDVAKAILDARKACIESTAEQCEMLLKDIFARVK